MRGGGEGGGDGITAIPAGGVGQAGGGRGCPGQDCSW